MSSPLASSHRKKHHGSNNPNPETINKKEKYHTQNLKVPSITIPDIAQD